MVTYRIDQAYDYPITSESPVWSTYTSLEERIRACRVSDNLLAQMQTPALLETILNYPLLVCMHAFGTIQEGMESVSSYFGGIEELCTRPDALAVINSYYGMEIRKNDVELTKIYLDALKEYILTQNSTYTYAFARSSTVTLLTEGGRRVTAYQDLTWSDHGTNLTTQERIASDYLDEFPTASRVASPSPKYNCHSYAWWTQSTSNRYWIDNPHPFTVDGIYEEVSYRNAEIITYETSGGQFVHSACYDGVVGGTVYVTSKWDECCVFRHAIDDCPYDASTDVYQGWARA